MKTNKFLTLATVIGLSSALLFTSCEKDDDAQMNKPKNIVEVAVSNPEFSILVQALTKAGLSSTLQGSGPFTVFAPTNAAFTQLFQQMGISSIDALTAEQLTPILLYHVLQGQVTSTQLESGYISTLSPGAGGANVSLKVDAGTNKLNGDVSITMADIAATNGVIHVIDRVLLPPTVADIAIANSNFTSLVAALTKAQLVETLKGNGNFTVFAPTNEAFNQLFTGLNVTLNDLSADQLTPVLLYHVLGSVVKSDQLVSGYTPTLSMGPGENYVSLSIDATNAKLNGSVNITLTDIVGTNGIVHVIDKVLVPPTVVDKALANTNFSILVAALEKANLVETLKGDGPFTVFAPTNEAFNNLFSQLGISGVNDLTAEQLTPILLDHVVSGNITSSMLTTGSVETLNSSITITVGNPVVINNDINVVLANVQASNGVIHVINKVIINSRK